MYCSDQLSNGNDFDKEVNITDFSVSNQYFADSDIDLAIIIVVSATFQLVKSITTFQLIKCCLICFIPVVQHYLPH